MKLSKYKTLGAGTTLCFRLRDLENGARYGFSKPQWDHMQACIECRRSYHMFLCIRRNEAREKLNLDAIERKF